MWVVEMDEKPNGVSDNLEHTEPRWEAADCLKLMTGQLEDDLN